MLQSAKRELLKANKKSDQKQDNYIFSVCEQLLKGIIYPLAAKAHNVCWIEFIKESASGAAWSSSCPFVGVISLSLLIYPNLCYYYNYVCIYSGLTWETGGDERGRRGGDDGGG